MHTLPGEDTQRCSKLSQQRRQNESGSNPWKHAHTQKKAKRGSNSRPPPTTKGQAAEDAQVEVKARHPWWVSLVSVPGECHLA